jgi:RNAse (barnase) inhibitor barstar
MPQGALHRIELRVDDSRDEWAEVAVYIDGVSFIDLVKSYEEARGYFPAGSYGCNVRCWTAFRGDQPWRRDGRVTLLLCGCQNLGCKDFAARVTATDQLIVWTDFQQDLRSPGSPGEHWDYAGFGPFRFDRNQYEAALAAAGLLHHPPMQRTAPAGKTGQTGQDRSNFSVIGPVMSQEHIERRSLVKLDVRAVGSVRELHERLAEALEFPAFYGKNWDAFWDSITGLVEMPRRLVITGWSNVASRWPKDAEIMLGCLRDLNEQHPSSSCEVELHP